MANFPWEVIIAALGVVVPTIPALYKFVFVLADRFRIVCAAGAGCGLRQGEILGLSLDGADPADMCLYIQRQIRVVGRTLVFALPKRGRKRRVPLSTGVLAALRVHEREFPSPEITLP